MVTKSLRLLLVFLFLQAATLSHASAPNTVVATINVGQNPSSIAITPDSRFAYVTNSNNNGVPGGSTVSVLNLMNNTQQQSIYDPSFSEPYRVTINPAGTLAYVSNSGGSTVTIINIATNTVSGVIDGFDGPTGMVITPNGMIGYVNNYGAAGGVGSGNGTTVSVVSLVSNTIINTITVDQAPAALAISPNGAFVYSINYVDGEPNHGTMNVIQTSSNTVTATIPGFSGPFGIAITPNGQYAYVTNFGSNNFYPVGTTVSVVNLSSNTIVASPLVVIQPSGVAITPDGRYAYVTNYNTLYGNPSNFTDLVAGLGVITIIDTVTNTVVPPIIGVGLSPDYMAIAPNGRYGYVTNYTSNTVTVVALSRSCQQSCCPYSCC